MDAHPFNKTLRCVHNAKAISVTLLNSPLVRESEKDADPADLNWILFVTFYSPRPGEIGVVFIHLRASPLNLIFLARGTRKQRLEFI